MISRDRAAGSLAREFASASAAFSSLRVLRSALAELSRAAAAFESKPTPQAAAAVEQYAATAHRAATDLKEAVS